MRIFRAVTALSLAALAHAQAPATPAAAGAAADATPKVTDPVASSAGQCKSYAKGSANLVLCVQKVTTVNPKLQQVGGYLLNNGTVPVCDVKLRTVNAGQVYDFWPDWATSSQYEVDFNPQQVTAVGVSMLPNADGSAPGVELVSFRDCGEAPAATTKASVQDVGIEQVKIEDPKIAQQFGKRQLAWGRSSGSASAAAPASSSLAVDPATAAAGAGGVGEDGMLSFKPNGPAPAGQCKEYTKGEADLVLCIQNVTSIPQNKVLVQGFLYNKGQTEACDVKIRPTNVQGRVYDFWPDWAMAASYEMFFNVEQFSLVGVTAERNGDGSMPNIDLYSFRDCKVSVRDAMSQPAKVVDVPLSAVRVPKPEEEAQEDMDYGDAAVIDVDGEVLGDETLFNRRLAEEVYTNVPVINPDYQFCRAYKGADNVSEVTICLDNAKAWRDRKMGRIVQTNLVLLNSGSTGVCNVSVVIENLDKEVGDHYPQLIDDNGFDTFPNFTTYYAPGRITNFGASIPKAQGVPHVYVPPTFAPCPEDNAAKRKFKCSESSRGADTRVKICVYTDLKEWKELDGSRTVAVEGFVSNTGKSALCNVTVNIQDFGKAKAFWGDWMPTYPKLTSGSTLKWGANIPFAEGWPRVSLAKYSVCPKDKMAPPKEAPKAGEGEDTEEAAAPAAADGNKASRLRGQA